MMQGTTAVCVSSEKEVTLFRMSFSVVNAASVAVVNVTQSGVKNVVAALATEANTVTFATLATSTQANPASKYIQCTLSLFCKLRTQRFKRWLKSWPKTILTKFPRHLRL